MLYLPSSLILCCLEYFFANNLAESHFLKVISSQLAGKKKNQEGKIHASFLICKDICRI